MKSGSVDQIKKEISSSYAAKLDAYKKEKEEAYAQEITRIDDEYKHKIDQAKTHNKDAAANAYRSRLSEGILNSKKEFESEREKLIDEVFAQAKKESAKVLKSDEYISAIKAFVKGKEVTLRGPKQYQKQFSELEVDESLPGIVVIEGASVYDFSYEVFLETKKVQIRHKVSEVLFS